MTKITMSLCAVVVISLGAMGCGDDGGSVGGGGDCARICGSSCIEDVLPVGAFDDCVRACEMGGSILDNCLSETAAVLACLETIDCGRSGSTECLDQSLAFSDCVSP